jgi:hypothetical protein
MSDGDNGYYFDQQAADEAAYQANALAFAGEPPAPAPSPEPAPSYSEPAPTYSEPAPTYNAPAYTAPAAPSNQWEQTVNDIYQQTFGRQADASGMASFTAALNAGMTGEQMRAALASSAEGQSRGLPPVPPLAAAAAAADPNAGWEYQPEEFYDSGGSAAPYYRNVITGERKEVGQPVQATGVTPVDPNTLAQHVGQNFEGTPTQFYDAQGNLKGILVDAVRAGLNTREGELIIDPSSLGLALKPNETASLDSKIQQRNEQGQLLFVDPNTGGTTVYNTGVPAETGSTVKDLLYINERKYGGQIPADMAQGALLLAATMMTGGVGGALLEAAGIGAGAGAGGAGAGALSDVAASNLMNSGLLPAGMQIPASGINWAAAATQAAKTAGINAAVTAAQGGNIGDVLKAGALGAVTGGAGVAGADLLGGGALAQIGSQTAIATAMAAATGRDPVQAAISGALTATLANVVPASTSDVLNSAGITDPSVQKAVNAAISSSVITAIRGGDVGTAAIMGAVNSGLSSVAGMIGDSKIVQDIKADITNALTSTVDAIKYETGATNALALPIEGSNKAIRGTELDIPTQRDVVNDIFQQDAQDAMIRDLPKTPPLVQNAINQNTPKTVDNVVIPPLIQQATGQSDANAIYNQLVANAANPTVGAPLTSLAGATTNDVNPVAVPAITDNTDPESTVTLNVKGSADSRTVAELLELYKEAVNPNATIDTPEFQDMLRRNAVATPEIDTEYVPEDSEYVPANNLDNIPVAPTTVVTDGNVPTTAPLGVANILNLPPNIVRLSEEEARDLGIAPGLYSISAGGQPTPVSTFVPSDNTVPVTPQDVPALRNITDRATQSDMTALVDENGNLIPNAFQNATPEQVDALLNRYINNPESISAVRQDLQPVTQVEVVPPEVQKPEPVQPAPQPPLTPEKVKPEEVKPEKTPTASASSSSSGDTKPAGGLGTQGGAEAGNEGAPGAVSPSGAASFAEAQNIVSEAASNEDLSAEDIIIATQRLVFNSTTLGASPAQAVASGLVTPDGSLTDRGVKRISDATGLSPSDVVELTNGATTARTGTGSGITSTGAGAATGAASGAALAGTGIGGSTGTNTGGLGTGTGTGVGPGTGTGTGDGSGDGLGLGSGSGSGSGTSGSGTGGVRPTVAPAIAQPSYSYSGAGSQGTTVGALPGNLQATFLQGANVDEYNPFENYNVYQQLAPVRAAEGGSPLQLAQMQQGVYGVDPRLYSVLQKRAAPSYFTYGSDSSGGNPTTFAGSQPMGKPTPSIPVIPTGKASGSDWLYQGAGSNPLAMAGSGIPSLGAGTMAEGGSAHDSGEGEHIPEFITGATGHYVRGRGDGQSDDIPAMLADGEYVFDASTVSTLGNGSSDAGAKLLDAFRKSLRDHTRSAPADKIPPKASPLEYMKEALQNVGRK